MTAKGFRIVVYCGLASFIFWATVIVGIARAEDPPEPLFDCYTITSGNDGPNNYGGTNQNDCWSGLGGNDIAIGYGGHDRFILGDGRDQACGGNCGGAGGDVQDVLKGNSGDDNLIGDGGNDYLYGGGGNDSIKGNDGDDVLAACDGQGDVVSGGGGLWWDVAYLDRNLDSWSGIDEKHFC